MVFGLFLKSKDKSIADITMICESSVEIIIIVPLGIKYW